MKQTGKSLHADDLQTILDSAANATEKGMAQFVTPPELARACALPLPAYRAVVADLQCGHGALLESAGGGFRDLTLLGCDIQKSEIRNQKSEIAQADCTRLYPLLAEAGCEFDLLTLNPPFSLQWHTERLRGLRDLLHSSCISVTETFGAIQGKPHIDSVLATLLMALDRCTERGEGFLICTQQAAERILGDRETGACGASIRKHIWAWLTVPGCQLFANASIDLAVLWFARSHWNGPTLFDSEPDNASILATCRVISGQRIRLRHGVSVTSQYDANQDTVKRWQLACEEYRIRQGEKQQKLTHNIWLEPDGRLATFLTPFQKVSTRLPVADVKALRSIHGQFPAALVVQKQTRSALSRAVRGGIWTVHPDVLPKVDDALRSYDAIRAPFFPLNDVQRLGFLDEEDSITCRKDFGPFRAGRDYRIECATRTLSTEEKRLTLSGEHDTVRITGCEMVITIRDGNGQPHEFLPNPKAAAVNEREERQSRKLARWGIEIQKPASSKQLPTHDLHALIEHFTIPPVPSIAEVHPERYQAALAAIHEIEAEINARLAN